MCRFTGNLFRRDLGLRLVDPDFRGKRCRDRAAMRESLGMRDEGGVEDGAASRACGGGETVMHLVRGAEAERAVTMHVVVPIEEATTVAAGVDVAAFDADAAYPVALNFGRLVVRRLPRELLLSSSSSTPR